MTGGLRLVPARVIRAVVISGRVRATCDAGCHIAEQAVSVDADDACALVLDDRGHVVLEVTAEHTAEQLNVRVLRDQHVDIPEQRVGLDVDLGRGAAGSREVDRHIAQDRDRDQLVLDIPCLRSLATSAALEHRVDREQPSTALSKSS